MRLWLGLLCLALAACGGNAQALDCPVTQAPEGQAVGVHGDPDGLQVLIYGDGVWSALTYDDGHYGQKVWWSHPDYDWVAEERPDFFLTGVRLDGVGYFQSRDGATNARLAELGGSAILTGADIPAPGCWRLTGIYRNSQVSFVVYVQP